MEGIERYSSEIHDRKIRLDTYEMLVGNAPAINPQDLILPAETEPGHVLPWIEGWDIANDAPILVPAQAVFHPLPRNFRQIFRTSTNGLASGNTREEAIFHALCEVIERDAWSLVEATRDTGPAVTGIDDPMLAEMQKKFTDAKVDVIIRDITSDIGIPTIAAVADDVLLKDPSLLTIGIGTHTNARIAVMRALTEVAQSRLTQIHGAREDTITADLRKKMGYDRVKRINGYWFKDNGTVNYDELHSYDSDDFARDIQFAIDALKKQGLDRVIVVDLTREEIGVPVVRVIVPGLEAYAMDPERRGDRLRHAKNHRFPRAKP
jgi:ribosomal protein S12 methylthiotransferase accessory factor